MTELRTEEEQVEALKKWWKANGVAILLAVVVGLAGYFGYNYWKNQQSIKLDAASDLYNQLVQIAAKPSLDSAEQDQALALANELKADYAGTTYAQFGALFVARFAVEKGEFDQAAAELSALAKDSSEDSIKYTATARLAQVLVQQAKFDEALALVNTVPNTAYTAQFEEVKGDALYRKGDLKAAREAYLRAKEAAQAMGANPIILQRKVDALTPSGEA